LDYSSGRRAGPQSRSIASGLFASHRDEDDEDDDDDDDGGGGDELAFEDAGETEGDDGEWTTWERWERGGRSPTRESSLCGGSGGPTRREERWEG
jgi:hypothetical protein